MIIKPNATSKELDDLSQQDGNSMLTQMFSSASKQQAQETLAKMNSRHKDIQKLEKSIIVSCLIKFTLL